jgi:pimeloyl-ACP methyl ester carboxylesterase
MGGLTAIWYSALNPRGMKANILIAPAFEMAGRALLSLGPQRAQRWRRERTIHMETEFAEFDLGYGFVEDEFRYPAASLIKRLKTPTLILHGSDDESVPCQLSRKFASRVDVAKLVEIEGGDHRLTEHKEALFEEMWDFVGPCQFLF